MDLRVIPLGPVMVSIGEEELGVVGRGGADRG